MSEPGPRPLTAAEALVPIVLGGLLLGLSFRLFGDAATGGPLQTAIICATAGAMLIGRRAGHGFDAMREAAVASMIGGFGTMAVLFAVGALLGTWAMSGTLLALGYYLLQVLTPEWLYLSSALIAALVGLAIASAWTTASTIGVCLVGIAIQLGLDPAITVTDGVDEARKAVEGGFLDQGAADGDDLGGDAAVVGLGLLDPASQPHGERS